MPETSITLIGLLVIALAAGLGAGWLFRGKQAEGEKRAISAGWKDQLEAQRKEHERLLEQNRSLMEQNSQYQASNKDSRMRAAELSDALKEAFERRDELQRQIKDIRGNLEATLAARERLEHDVAHRAAEVDVTATALKQRDDRIARLQKELKGWQERVPPLVERFRERNEQATRLEEQLAGARARIRALEDMVGSDDTRVEPVDPAAFGEAIDASNEPMEPLPAKESGEEAPAAPGPEPDQAPGPKPAAGALDGDEATAAAETGEDTDEAGERSPAEAAEEPEDTDDEGARTAEASGDDDPDPEADADEDLRAAPESERQENPAASVNGGDRDNLKVIKGVGPAIEKTLNEMGIRRLHQIAEMSEYDIDRIARRLKGFRTRIYREDWMGQARSLLEQQEAATRH